MAGIYIIQGFFEAANECHDECYEDAQLSFHDPVVTPRSPSMADLCVACEEGDLGAVLALVEAGASIHERNDAAFRVACSAGNLAVAQWLVAQGGVDIHARENYAFSMACAVGHLAVGRWLVQQDPEYQNWPATEMACLKTWSKARAAWMRSVVGLGGDGSAS